MELIKYLQSHAVRVNGDCNADVVFFGVNKTPDASAEELKAHILKHKGEFCDVNLFDGKEHNYLELGGWIGDQGMALTLIGLGAALGLWKLLTPKTMLGDLVDAETIQKLAGAGYISMQAA